MRLPFAVLVWSLVGVAQESGSDRAIFRTGVSLVHVDAEVTAEDGRILGDLSKSDFRVFDQRKEQPLLHCSLGDEPLDLILLFDISGSMRPVVNRVSEAARAGLAELRDGDRVAVMVFNTRSRMVQPFTEDLQQVERAIREEVLDMPFDGGTRIQSAVDDAAKRFLRQKRDARRRAILIITDNVGQRTMKESTVVRDLWEADTILSGLIVRSGAARTLQTVMMITSPHLMAMQAGMTGIAEKTGGDSIYSDDPGAGFQDAMRRIRTRYSLYYAQPKDNAGSKRNLRVELTKDAAKRFPRSRIRARVGYIVPRVHGED
jgi:VWFA-related protein